MNKTDIKSKASELKSRFNDFSYENFAEKNPRTGRPFRLTPNSSKLIDDLGALVSEASKEFPRAQLDSLFAEGKELFNLRIVAMNNNGFEKGKAVLLEAIDLIKQNILEEERKNQPKTPSKPIYESLNKNLEKKIFVSYYDEQMWEQIQAVFESLQPLDSKRGRQSDPLEALGARIDEITSCSGAIVCLPPNDTGSPMAYIDLGACLALFPNKTLLIHQGEELPDNIVSKVEIFHYLGDLTYKQGVELSGKILRILQDN